MTTTTHDEESFGNHKTGNRVDRVSYTPLVLDTICQINPEIGTKEEESTSVVTQ